MDIVARREYFGYLFMDRESERLFSSHYKGDLPHDDPGRLVLPVSDGERLKANSIDERKALVIRDDILSAPTYVEFYPTMRCNERCHFCYVGEVLNTGKGFPSDQISEMVENIGRYSKWFTMTNRNVAEQERYRALLEF